MTAPELNAFLENLARLIEASAQSVKDAARLVRECKVKEYTTTMNSIHST